MFKTANLILLMCETAMHAGTGSEIGVVDLPIQREAHTKFPKIESSSIKGSIRDFVSLHIDIDEKLINPIFGPEDGDLYASAVSFLDAKILLFPVKSAKNIFTWVTCPLVLRNFVKTIELIQNKNYELNNQKLSKLIEMSDFSVLVNTVSSSAVLLDYDSSNDKGKIVLEEYVFDVSVNNETASISEVLADLIFDNESLNERDSNENDKGQSNDFWKKHLKNNLAVISDNDFEYFVQYSTEVVTRIAIDKSTGTVKEGALWTEEYLPENTVMYTGVLFSNLKVRDEEKNNFLKIIEEKYGYTKEDSEYWDSKAIQYLFKSVLDNRVIQIGGNQSLGKGFVRVRITG